MPRELLADLLANHGPQRLIRLLCHLHRERFLARDFTPHLEHVVEGQDVRLDERVFALGEGGLGYDGADEEPGVGGWVAGDGEDGLAGYGEN